MVREPSDFYFLRMAMLVSERGTCARRQVGSIFINKKNHIIATGYNGNPSGFQHCISNALLQCKDVYEIDRVYCTLSPCIHCIKLLLNTSARHILFCEEYIHQDAKRLWKDSNREWSYISKNTILGKLN